MSEAAESENSSVAAAAVVLSEHSTPTASDGLVHIQLTPESHAILSAILLAGVERTGGAERARLRRLAGACKVDGDRLWDIQ